MSRMQVAAALTLALVGAACRGQPEVSTLSEPTSATALVVPVPKVASDKSAKPPKPPKSAKSPKSPKPPKSPAPPVATAPDPAPPPPKPTVVTHPAAGGIEEICQLLVAFPFEPTDVKQDPKAVRWYRKDDFEDIADLCTMSFYAPETTDTVTAVGVCPKTHWSTPALEFHAIDKAGLKKTDFEKQRCKRDRRFRGAKKIAKFKVRVYDKEPESQLMYFHFSRLLGAASFIMPATYRTIARSELQRWTNAALARLKGPLYKLNPLEGWSVLYFRHRKGPDVIGGTFSENARGEGYYKPFTYYPDKKTRIGRITEFRSQPYYKIVASKRPLEAHLTFDPSNRRRFDKSLQTLAIAQDFTHMLILDHVFNQRDRGGNIHSWVRYHRVDDKQHLRWKKKLDHDDDPDANVRLERLLLKDNDDGLRWNAFGYLNASVIIDELRHLDSLTYERLQWLAKLMTEPASRDAVKAYFVDSVRVAPDTYDDVRARLVDLAARFARKHAAGTLMLDLDLEPVLAMRSSNAAVAGKAAAP